MGKHTSRRPVSRKHSPLEIASSSNVHTSHHHLRNDVGEIETVTTAQVVGYAKEILEVFDAEPPNLDTLARQWADIWNSAYPDIETGLPGIAGIEVIDRLFAASLHIVRAEIGFGGHAIMKNAVSPIQELGTISLDLRKDGSGHPKYVRLDALLAMVPFSASTVWRKSREGSFVRPTKLSARITAWNRQAVVDWLQSQEAL